MDFPTSHGAADINHKDYVLRHHWEALRCEEVHKVAIDDLPRWERDNAEVRSLSLGGKVSHFHSPEGAKDQEVLEMEERDAAAAP